MLKKTASNWKMGVFHSLQKCKSKPKNVIPSMAWFHCHCVCCARFHVVMPFPRQQQQSQQQQQQLYDDDVCLNLFQDSLINSLFTFLRDRFLDSSTYWLGSDLLPLYLYCGCIIHYPFFGTNFLNSWLVIVLDVICSCFFFSDWSSIFAIAPWRKKYILL